MIRLIRVDISRGGDAALEDYRRKTFRPYRFRCRSTFPSSVERAIEAMRRLGVALREAQRLGYLDVYREERKS